MKRFAFLFAVLFVCLCLQTVAAQDAWSAFSPAEESFTVEMPRTPTPKTQKQSFEQFNVDGHLYTTTSSGIEYDLWSLKNQNFANFKISEGLDYGDACADLIWESLLKPWRDELPKPAELHSGVAYQPNLSSIKLPGRD